MAKEDKALILGLLSMIFMFGGVFACAPYDRFPVVFTLGCISIGLSLICFLVLVVGTIACAIKYDRE